MRKQNRQVLGLKDIQYTCGCMSTIAYNILDTGLRDIVDEQFYSLCWIHDFMQKTGIEVMPYIRKRPSKDI